MNRSVGFLDRASGRPPAADSTESRKPSLARAAPVRPARSLLLGLVAIGVVVALTFGWSTRDEYYVVPSEGIGYALGIIGLAMMLLLLLYSLRKRWLLLSRAGPIQHWFHVHMALGLAGPAAILFHSNFSLGSLNANIALLCMLVVSLSGVVGRFIYTKIHFEYMGHIATLDELTAEARTEGRVLAAAMEIAPEMGLALDHYRERCLDPEGSVRPRAGAFLELRLEARAARRQGLRAYRSALSTADADAPSVREVRRALKQQLRGLRRVAEYGGYERAFALWHTFHLPFTVGLFMAAAVHVVAVHMY